MSLPASPEAPPPNPLAHDVRRWGEWVLEQARAEIGHLYDDPEGRTIVGYLWARTARCPNPVCGAEMPMVRQWWLAKKNNRKVAIRPVVERETHTIRFEIAEGDEIDFDPAEGTMRRGHVRCLVCGQSPEPDYLKQEGRAGRLGAVPMAVIYDRPKQSGKGYRPVTDFDRAHFAEAERLLAERLAADPDALPNEPIPDDDPRNVWIYQYGFTRWGDLFNARQALALITFVDKVREAHAHILAETGDADYARAVTTYLAFMLDRLTSFNATLCWWQSNGEFLVNLFGRQALPMVWDYAELNPFGGRSGDWRSALSWIVRVIEHAALASPYTADLHRGDATRLTPNPASLDAIITDPPYYDAISYANLADFFYVWLKRSIGELYPTLFTTPLTPKAPEIIQEPARHGGQEEAKAFYEEQMTRAFAEAQRVLRDDGIFVVVFAHKSTAAWETLLNSLLQAGLVVTASWPLHTERPGRLRAHDSAALASSIFIVCRKRAADEVGLFSDVRGELRETIRERLDFFWSQGIRGADFFIAAIGPAVSVFGRYRQVRKLSGEAVSVAELLDLVQEMVADYALGKVMNGRYRMGAVDAPTRFYVMYRWSYGAQKLPFDDARRLAQGIGAEVDTLIHRLGLLQQRGETVTLRGPLARERIERLGEPHRDGENAPLIDVLHRAVLLWREGNRHALAEFLAEHAAGREDGLQAVAQALINVLPSGNKERQLLEGFLTGQDHLPNVPQQKRLL